MRHHLTSVRMAKINNSGHNRYWQGCRERGTLLHSGWECIPVQTLENSMDVPQKIKKKRYLWPRNYTTRCLSKGYKNADSKGHIHPHVYGSAINNSQIMERSQMSINWWMNKEDVVYIHTHTYIHTYTHTHTHTHTHTLTGILPEDQKEWNLVICNNMDGTRGYYTKPNKSVRERQIPCDFTHLWNLRNTTDEHRRR